MGYEVKLLNKHDRILIDINETIPKGEDDKYIDHIPAGVYSVDFNLMDGLHYIKRSLSLSKANYERCVSLMDEKTIRYLNRIIDIYRKGKSSKGIYIPTEFNGEKLRIGERILKDIIIYRAVQMGLPVLIFDKGGIPVNVIMQMSYIFTMGVIIFDHKDYNLKAIITSRCFTGKSFDNDSIGLPYDCMDNLCYSNEPANNITHDVTTDTKEALTKISIVYQYLLNNTTGLLLVNLSPLIVSRFSRNQFILSPLKTTRLINEAKGFGWLDLLSESERESIDKKLVPMIINPCSPAPLGYDHVRNLLAVDRGKAIEIIENYVSLADQYKTKTSLCSISIKNGGVLHHIEKVTSFIDNGDRFSKIYINGDRRYVVVVQSGNKEIVPYLWRWHFSPKTCYMTTTTYYMVFTNLKFFNHIVNSITCYDDVTKETIDLIIKTQSFET